MTIGEIESIVIEVLAEEKAYNVPNVGSKYGLEYGTEDESFKSKTMYLSKRLKGKSNLFILDMADRVAKDYNSTKLRKVIAQYNDLQKYQINGKLRRILLDELYNLGEELEGELDLIPFLNRVWDLKSIPSAYGGDGTMEDSVLQHMIRNDDWDYNELFDTQLDVISSDDNIFAKFLETLVDPVVRKGPKQRAMIILINTYIVEENYELVENGSKLGLSIFKLMSKKSGVDGQVKNIIFSSDGPKPELVFSDAMNNDISIVKNEENCLIYNRRIPETGLKWDDLVAWWKMSDYHVEGDVPVDRELFNRLEKSLDSSFR